MAYEPREGQGSLFTNDKGDNPARPDYRGDIMLDGVVYEISGWIKPLPSDPSRRFLSLAGKPKAGRQAQQGRTTAPPQRQQPPRRDEPPMRPSPRSAGFDDDGPPF
jgi:hypothetical protein